MNIIIGHPSTLWTPLFLFSWEWAMGWKVWEGFAAGGHERYHGQGNSSVVEHNAELSNTRLKTSSGIKSNSAFAVSLIVSILALSSRKARRVSLSRHRYPSHPFNPLSATNPSNSLSYLQLTSLPTTDNKSCFCLYYLLTSLFLVPTKAKHFVTCFLLPPGKGLDVGLSIFAQPESYLLRSGK